jgi:hypothetical protein
MAPTLPFSIRALVVRMNTHIISLGSFKYLCDAHSGNHDVLVLFRRFQEGLVNKERRAQAELRQAHALLEEQNATLEQRVQERTSELQASNHSLEQRNAALGISSVSRR